MNQRDILGALALDLKRAALGLHRGSNIMATRFTDEALKRIAELEQTDSPHYLKKLLTNSKQVLKKKSDQAAEDLLMYSTLFQNLT